jgi:hypothetical protein
MKPQTVERLESELAQAYTGTTSASDAARRLVKLPEIHFPAGCRPSIARALVVIDPASDKPELYLSDIPILASGNRPATGQLVIAGETWNSFSFALRNWDPDTNTAEQFVEGKLRRFSLAA